MTMLYKSYYKRVFEHKNKLLPGFTAKYNITRLVYFEETNDVQTAIAREKQIKGWLRKKKLALISSVNPKWEDLSSDWYKGEILMEARRWIDERFADPEAPK